MIIEHSGTRFDAAKQPIEAIKLALKASAGAGSKRSAWEWAQHALRVAQLFAPELAKPIDAALENSQTDFPNAALALAVVDNFKRPLPPPIEAAILRERLRLQCDAWAEVIIAINDTDAPDHVKAPMLAIAEAKLTELQTEMRNLKAMQP